MQWWGGKVVRVLGFFATHLLPVTWGRVTNQSSTHSVTAAAVAVRTARMASCVPAPWCVCVCVSVSKCTCAGVSVCSRGFVFA